MTPFRDLPIKRKLMTITMLTSCLALLLTCFAFVLYEQISYRKHLAAEMATTAGIIGDNCAAALAFDDPDGAEEVLKSLTHQKSITAAAVYDMSGTLFAFYRNSAGTVPLAPLPMEREVHRFTEGAAEQFHDIKLSGETIGTIYLRHDMSDLHKLRRNYAIIAAAVMLGASLVSWVVSSRLQRTISEPVGALAGVAARVASEKDYSLRAVKQGNDELGQLIDGFNGMLDQIQQRDSALKAAQDELEYRVGIRTAELADSLSVLAATIESTADGIFALHLGGKVVSYNSRFTDMWEMPPEIVARGDAAITDFAAGRVLDPDAFRARAEEILAHPEKEAFDTLELADGRTFERYCKPQRIEGKSVGFVINFRDITERKQSEAETQRLNKCLVSFSRQAGMSEVATSVLHNVGNVLNSVNISCSVISELTRNSRISSVVKTAELLRENKAGLAAFLTNDPVGLKLPGFLTKLAARLKQEQSAVQSELQSLADNIDHIKDIVAVQQTYAKNLGGVRETLPLENLVEDALRMNECALTSHSVTITREYGELPDVPMEKHKVLQILVNLIRNAKHALADSARDELRLTLRTATREGFATVSVIDNGVGVAPENLIRIFAHGFTTKHDGHGFGLHSGVLAAQEMGGRLTVHSAGCGEGATFTLELPLTPNPVP